MFRKIKKVYRIACIAIGKKKVNMILLAASLVCLYMGYRNHFDIQKTMTDIFQTIDNWKHITSLPVR